MHREEGRVLSRVEPQERRAQQRPAPEVERLLSLFVCEPLGRALARGRRQAAQLDERHRARPRRVYELGRLALVRVEGGAQRLVTAYDFAERAVEGVQVE